MDAEIVFWVGGAVVLWSYYIGTVRGERRERERYERVLDAPWYAKHTALTPCPKCDRTVPTTEIHPEGRWCYACAN